MTDTQYFQELTLLDESAGDFVRRAYFVFGKDFGCHLELSWGLPPRNLGGGTILNGQSHWGTPGGTPKEAFETIARNILAGQRFVLKDMDAAEMALRYNGYPPIASKQLRKLIAQDNIDNLRAQVTAWEDVMAFWVKVRPLLPDTWPDKP